MGWNICPFVKVRVQIETKRNHHTISGESGMCNGIQTHGLPQEGDELKSILWETTRTGEVNLTTHCTCFRRHKFFSKCYTNTTSLALILSSYGDLLFPFSRRTNAHWPSSGKSTVEPVAAIREYVNYEYPSAFEKCSIASSLRTDASDVSVMLQFFLFARCTTACMSSHLQP